MFVRWKKRAKAKDHVLAAYLVQSVRIGGKPRHKVLAHLCTLESSTIQKGNPDCWLRVEDVLTRLEISQEDSEKIYQAIAKKTPRPPSDYLPRYREKKRLEWEAWQAQYPSLRDDYVRPPDNPPAIGEPVLPQDVWSVLWKRGFRTYQVFLTKQGERKGKPYLENIGRLASIDENRWQYVSERKAWWKDFWTQIHCSLCAKDVECEVYQDIFNQLSQWAQLPTNEEMETMLDMHFRSKQHHIDSELERIEKRAEKLRDEDFALLKMRRKTLYYTNPEKYVPPPEWLFPSLP